MKTSYKIKITEGKEAMSFLKQNRANLQQISLNSEADFYFGAFNEFDLLIGILGVTQNKNIIRIKQFYIKEKHRGKGVGTMLLKYILKDDKKYSVFATKFSQELFLKNGFVIKTEKQNDIKFMEKEIKNV